MDAFCVLKSMAGKTVKIIIDFVATDSNAAKKPLKEIETEAKKVNANVKADAKQAQKEVDAIHRQTAQNAKQSQKVIEHATKSRIAQELKDERFADKTKKDYLRSLETTNKTSATNFGSAWKTAGGVAAAGLLIGISAATAFASTAADLGVQAVQLAGNFEVTTNALKVFTGSARLANKELTEIESLAKNTPGLRLESAQAGFQQLRALGFGAKQAGAFIKELGEEKILSGASDDALQRIIFNFAQIRTGGQKVGQELREILTAMPTMQRAFLAAFGTLDPQKIQKFFDADMDDAFKRLTDAMAKGEAASGGFNDAMGKILDAFIKAGREFGTPILEPLTKDLKQASIFIDENKATIREWGQSTADVYRGLTEVIAAFDTRQDTFLGKSTGRLIALIELGKYFRGSLLSTLDDLAEAGEGKRLLQQRAGQSGVIGAKTQAQLDGEREIAVIAEQTNAELYRQEQKAIKERLEIVKSYYDNRVSLLESGSKRELALLDSQLTYTVEQEIQVTQRRAEITDRNLRQQLIATRNYYSEVLADLSLSENEKIKLQFEAGQKLRAINDEIYSNELKRQREVAEKERQILNNRRQAQITFSSKTAEIEKFRNDTAISDIERNLERGLVSTEEGYGQINAIIKGSFDEQIKLSREFYQLQLQDKTLSVEQRANLEREMYFTEEKLAEENRRRVLDIEEKRRNAFVKNLVFQRERMSSYLQDMSSLAATFQDNFFSPQVFTNATMSAFQQSVTQTGARDLIEKDLSAAQKEFDDNLKRWNEYKDFLKSINGFAGTDNDQQKAAWEIFNQNYDKALKKVQDLEAELTNLNNKIPRNYLEFEKLAKQIQGGNIKAFDQLSAALLKHRQALDTYDAQGAVDYYETLLENETDLAKQNEYRFNLQQAQRRLERLGYDQAAESARQYSESLEGLRKRIEGIQSGDTAGIKYLAEQNLLKDKINILENITRLEQKYYQDSEFWALRQKEVRLEAIREIWEADQRAIEDSIRANVRLDDAQNIHTEQIRARVLGHLAEQKTMSETIADSITNVYDSAASGIGQLLDKTGISKIPGVGTLVKGFATSKLTELTRGFLDNFFPGLGGQIEKTGNPIVDEQKQSNVYLKKIAEGSSLSSAFGGRGFGANIPFLSSNSPLASLGGGFGGIFGGANGQGGLSSILNGGGIRSLIGGGGALLGLGGSTAAGAQEATHAANIGGSGFGGLGSILMNPLTAILAGGALGGFLLWKLFQPSALDKLKKAAQSQYSVNVKDKSTLQALKSVGEGYFGKGQAGKKAIETVQTPEGKEIIENYAASTGQKSSALEKANYGDENWKGNQFKTRFGGFREFGGSVSAGMAYVVGEKRPELFIPNRSGTIAPSVSNGNPQMMAQMMEMLQVLISRLQSMKPGEVVTMGAMDAKDAIADAGESAMQGDWRRTQNLSFNTGGRI